MERELILKKEAKMANKIIRAVNHDFRQKILQLLATVKCLPVKEIYIRLKSDQTKVSGHLLILRKVGVVIGERRGKQILYSAVDARIEEINKYIAALATLANEIIS